MGFLITLGGRAVGAWRSFDPAERGHIKLLGMLVAFGAIIGMMQCRYERAADRAQAAALAASNERARADTTRAVAGLSAKDSAALRLGDSLAIVTHLAIQAKQSRDVLDRALKQERTATAGLTATIQQLRAQAIPSTQPITTDSGGTRRASFDIREAPYTAHADVALPPSGVGSLALRVAIDSAHVEARLGCTASADGFGVRAAAISLTAPRWLSLRVDSVSQAPEVCQKPAAAAAYHWWKPAITAGIGAVRGGGGQIIAGPSITLGWSFRPFGR